MPGSGKNKTASSSRGKAPSASKYDLGVPGLVADCVEEIYALSGTKVVPFDRFSALILFTSIIVGFYFGYEPGRYVKGEFLYGPIGAALGTVFGSVLGGSAAAFAHFILAPWLRPEANAMKLIRLGRIRGASDAIRRARFFAVKREGAAGRAFENLMGFIGTARRDLPRDMALANIRAVEGVLAEAAGDNAAAFEAYLAATNEWSRHGFAVVSMLDLVTREKMWEVVPEATVAGERYIEQTRDKTVARAVAEYLDLLGESGGKPAPEPKIVREETSAYSRGIKAEEQVECKIVENPGSQISNGALVVKSGGAEKTVRLPPMPFRLVMILAERVKSSPADANPAQIGWVSISDLLNDLPWTTPNVTNSNVHKLVYKTRNHLAQNDLSRDLIEENDNGCYRLALPPGSLSLEKMNA